jgi:phosphoserine phosphatase
MASLFVFDFDHTIVDDNSDTFLPKMCSEALYRELGEKYNESKENPDLGWTKLMDYMAQ